MPLSLKRPVWRALSITHRVSLRCAISATSIGNQLIHEPSCVDHLIGIAPWTLAVSNCGGHGQKEIDDADQHPPQGVRTGLTEGMSSFLNPSDIGWTDQHGNPRPLAPTRAEAPGVAAVDWYKTHISYQYALSTGQPRVDLHGRTASKVTELEH